MTMGENEPRFRDALEELEKILGGIEGDEVDIDELADKLKRARDLLEVCRAKIRRAEVEVGQIVEDLRTDDEREPSA